MKAALLFPGQGAQYFGMGKDLYDHYDIARQIFDKANTILDWNLLDLCFNTPNELIHQTRYTQAALFSTNYAIFKVLEAEGIKADAMLGFSLGEYDAIAASGALDFENTLKLVEKRGIYMEECANANPGGMSAVIGLETDKIHQACEDVRKRVGKIIAVANDNCEGQVTIAGEIEALDEASKVLKEMGARRIVPLKVSGAFHSLLMKEASERLKQELSGLPFEEPYVKVISNVSAREMNKDAIIENIPLQIIKGVRFRESVQYLLEQGFDTFIELGPKMTLSNLVKKISKDVTVYQVEDSNTFKNLLEKVGKNNAE